MSRGRVLALVVVAALAIGAGMAVAALPRTNECNGLRVCQRASGPWAVVSAFGEALYLVDCPARRGIVGGVDAIANTNDIHVTFDAQLGAPIGPGRTTTTHALFRGVSGKHRRGLFKPLVGCVPTDTTSGNTVSHTLPPGSPLRHTTAVNAVPGPPLGLVAVTIRVRAGSVRSGTIGCVPSQRLVDSWATVGFRTVEMPAVGLADAIKVTRSVKGKSVSVRIAVSEALPPGAKAEVQLGVMCAVT